MGTAEDYKDLPRKGCHRAIPHGGHAWVSGVDPDDTPFWMAFNAWCEGVPMPEETADDVPLPIRGCDSAVVHPGHKWIGPPTKEVPWSDAPNSWCKGVQEDGEIPRMRCDNLAMHPSHAWVAPANDYQDAWCRGRVINLLPQPKAPENRTLPVRWADRAMFKAEPMPEAAGPRVFLLDMNRDPLGHIAAASKMYKGEVVRDLRDVTDAERIDYLNQIKKTKLKAPFEFVKFHFMIEGVTRGFTHQMVRQRTAVYAQESTRFAVFGTDDARLPVGLPPSLSGTDVWDNVGHPTGDQKLLATWNETVTDIQEAYQKLVNSGMPAEDARGLLPTNLLTRLHYSTDLRALLDHAGNRLCTQAQFEWRLVFTRIIESIRARDIPRGTPREEWGEDGIYMANELLSLFRPVCFQTGKCEFKADFDRACSIRDQVDALSGAGVPPSLWEEEGNYTSGGHAFNRKPIPPIKPGQWLMDPGAARVR
jgi:flavin-dependent thymidylate synthase